MEAAVDTRPEKRARFWANAAAFGAVWGTLEITVGSFVHALRVPFSGVALAAMGAALLVAQRQILPMRGLTVATGLVAAACKMLSPGGVIFGPMAGIFVEALLVELALMAAPRALIGALLAGFLSVAWSVSQTFLTQYVLYGGDILSLYLAAIRKMGGWLHLDAEAGRNVAEGVIGLVFLLGGAGGLFGWRVGRLCSRRLAQDEVAR